MKFAALGITVVCMALFATWSFIGRGVAEDTAIAMKASELGLGPCTEESYLEYFRVAPDVGRLVIGQSPGFENKAGRVALRSAMKKIEFPENATTFVVAHDPSVEIYTKTCTSDLCSIEEISEPETQCLRDHSDFCYFVAIRYENRTYCTLYEEQSS